MFYALRPTSEETISCCWREGGLRTRKRLHLGHGRFGMPQVYLIERFVRVKEYMIS